MSETVFDSGARVVVEIEADTSRVLLTIGDSNAEGPFRLTESETERVIAGLEEGLRVLRASRGKPSTP